MAINNKETLIVQLLIVISCTSYVFSKSLFEVGKEYKYNYETLVTAGQERPASFASAYKIKGLLKIHAISPTTLNVGLDNLSVGLYNGPWSYFPIPEFNYFETPDLSALGERFHIVTENGKFKTLILNDLEPEWASNMKRGLAAYLQMDFNKISTFDQMQVFDVREMTTVGECSTKYEVLPASTTLNKMIRINKFRNHADCPDLPTRVKLATQNYYKCSDSNTRDIMNSTSYATYELEIQQQGEQQEPILKGITLYSSILMWPFTTSNSYQFSWLNMTISFNAVSKFDETQSFPPPENAENHEDLMFVFEQPDPSDAEDENPDLTQEALYFHHTGPDSDAAVQEKTMELCRDKIAQVAESLANSEYYLSNLERFHGDSPLSFIPLVSSLDYDHLKQCYQHYSDAKAQNQLKLTEFHLFLDGLILSGTSQATLLIRDILLSTFDVEILSRITTSFPHFIRNPTEAIAIEMAGIYELFSNNTNSNNISPIMKRMIELSMATLIGRCCKKTLCVSSGILDKYVNYFESKLTGASNFGGRTAAILRLRNLGIGRALAKVLDIASGLVVYEQPVRIQAIWALSNYQDKQKLFDVLLPVFYNRSESCEIRTSIFTLLMSSKPEKRVLHNIAYFMWTEHCPQTFNIVRSFLTNAMKSKSPCNSIGSYARTILNYLPPATIDPLRTTIYSVDYFDTKNGFGHEYHTLVQKSGTSAFPISIYYGVNNFIGGFAGSSIGIFIRVEGLDKTITSKLATIRQTNIEKVKKILAQIDITQRPTSPLYLEFILLWQNNVVVYYAADENSLFTLPTLLKNLSDVKDNIRFSWEQSTLLGGVFYQQPLEIGTPVSISFDIAAVGSLSTNISLMQSITGQKTSHRLQYNLFAKSTIANHVPVIGTMHGVTTHRTLRIVSPRNVNFEWDGDDGLKVEEIIPSEKNPVVLMTHGTSLVTIQHDSASNSKNDEVLALLKNSCPNCPTRAVISTGENNRKSRNLFDTENLSLIAGIREEGKFFDCERDHSRTAVMRQLNEFLSEENKNLGNYNLLPSKLFLTAQHAFDYLFWSPSPETCGLKFSLSQDEKSSTKLQTIETSISTEFQVADQPDGGKILNCSINAATDFKYVIPDQKSTIKTTLDISVNDMGNGTSEFKSQLFLIDQGARTQSAFCLDTRTEMNMLPKDVLAYDNENEPIVEETLAFKYGQLPINILSRVTPSQNCLSNLIDLKINVRASRSTEQIAESNSPISPYKECRAQKEGGISYGSKVPPTLQCFAAVLEQTSLRSRNVTVYYKISKVLPDKWKRYAWAVSGIIYPFYTSSGSQELSHQHPSRSPNDIAKDSNSDEGWIELDVNVKKDAPTSVDVHYQTTSNKQLNEELHFHGITLINLIPDYLKPRPVSGRFSPYLNLGFQSGFLGQCTISPTWISTLDNFNINTNISECPTLMSGDCGLNPQYAVLANKISPDKIGLNVQIGEDNVEFQQVSDTVKLNGRSVKLSDRRKHVAINFNLLKNDDEIFLISRLSGIHIRYANHFATITLDSRYRGVHCGLCGHWDSNWANDLLGPKPSCPTISPQSFMHAYVKGDEKSCKKSTTCSAS